MTSHNVHSFIIHILLYLTDMPENS